MEKQKTAWNVHLMKIYHEMKRKDKDTKLCDAMKVAHKSYKK